MPDRKEPRLEIDPVKPAASVAERPASAATANRPKPDATVRPAPPTSSPKTSELHQSAVEKPAASVKPGAPAKPAIEEPLRHQPVESTYKSERAGGYGQPGKLEASSHSADSGGSGGSGGGYPARLDSDGTGSGGSGLLIWFALLLALAGLIFGGWQYMRVDKQQQSMQVLADRVQELEIRLSATGQDLSEAGTTFSEQLKAANEKLKWADEEINKLWRLANNQMRPNIAGLQEQVKALESGLSRTERQSTEAASVARAANDKATEAGRNLQVQVEAVKKDLGAMGLRLTEVTLATSTLDQRLRNQDQGSRVAALSKKVEELDQRVSAGGIPPELQQKMTEQEEILASLEASRSQLVSRVTRLMDEVRELQQAR
jgi:hypothetical protein